MASRQLTRLYDEALSDAGIRLTQFSLLSVIRDQHIPITKLAERLFMDRTTLARELQPLQAQGWVQLRPGVDRRMKLVSLTAAGEALLERTFPLWQRAQEQVVEKLGARRVERLLEEWKEVARLTQE